ncbi:DinB family protein [Streptomyces palmae]|uniref:DinB family protein n=1 Tax=Streptomyces palmae TaxID=1701085 RepID=A0A4Z0HDD9_9ACTN|nr:DinB family protein [Streptomyces palmae]TGB15604.1 DinB family protein [Streptomyces palmae]
MTTERVDPPLCTDERTMLESWLDYHRSTLADKCRGLDDKQLREASVPPSSLSLLGLVRHMADVERHWFRRVLAGEQAPPLFYSDEDPDGEFHLTEADTGQQGFDAWQAEITAAREAAAGRSLDDTGLSREKKISLRWIYVHMIEEYARHNGHADLIRERIDGATGE